jgi:hypothetical protein
MGDFSDDYGGYDILGLYEQRDEDRKAQRAKLLTPPRRAWVGLTDAEIFELFGCIGTSNSDINPYALIHDARKIEAKLKEKNT